MLRALSVRNVVLIEALDLEFHEGLNVLTGETGAGKSILLDALGFALGARTRGDILREGAAEGAVTAEFDLPPEHPANAILDELEMSTDPGEPLILRRVETASGRRSGFVNDRRASAEVLRRLADTLLEVHGQHDDRGLLDPKRHRDLLDAFAEAGPAREATRAAWSALRAARRELGSARETRETAARDEDYLRHAVAELHSLDPQPGEDARLDTDRRRMQAAEKVQADVVRAAQALGSDGAERLLADATRWLEDVQATAGGSLDDTLGGPLAALARAFGELGEAQSGVEDTLAALEFDPMELERTEERLFALRGLARKHQVTPDALADLTEELGARLEAIDAGEGRIAALEADVATAESAYHTAARALSQIRRDAGGRLDAAMAEELAPLKMERAIFTTEIAEGEAGPDGVDAVSFTVATNPGAPSGPIARIASGGELSRFLLALKVCLTTRSDGLTLIFDEIDRGVGGATADAVGRRLAALADGAQVLVVTHSPQVAARGGSHWRIAKSVVEGATRTDVTPLPAPDRIDEIARMLAGDRITDEARAAARSLLRG